MGTTLLVSYATFGLAFFVHSVYRLSVSGRRREVLFTGADRVLLGASALLSSAAWILLVPVYVVGWARSEYLRQTRSAAQPKLNGPRRGVSGGHRGVALAR